MTTGLVLLAVGGLFCWLAWIGWRTRAEDRISLIEAAILRTTGAEPVSIARLDRGLQLFQLVMLSTFGPAAFAVGLIILFV